MKINGAKPFGIAKNSPPLVYVVRQIAERKGGRISLEENLPGLIVASNTLPVSKQSGEGLVPWACKEDVTSGMLGIRSASFAEGGFVWMEPSSIFASRGMVCQSASHTANGSDVIPGQRHEEVLACFIGDVGFELPASPFDWKPTAALVRMGCGENTPVSCHFPFELADKVRPQDLQRSGRAYSGALFCESVRALVSLDADV